MDWLIGAILVVGVLIVALAQTHTYVIQYLFFCRFPLIIALTLSVFLPWGMCTWARTTVGNLAVLPPLHVGLVALAATLAAWAVLLTTARLLLWVPRYADLWFYREPAPPRLELSLRHPVKLAAALSERVVGFGYQQILGLRSPGLLKWKRLVLYFVLALPLIVVTVVRSSQELDNQAGNVLAALIGIGVAVGMRYLGSRVTSLLKESGLHGWITDLDVVKGALGEIDSQADRIDARLNAKRPSGASRIPDEKVEAGVLVYRTLEGLGFFIVLGIFFLVIGFVLHPPHSDVGPALPVVIMALLALLFVFSTLSAFLDKLRVPVVLVVVAVTFSLFQLFKIDHFYEVRTLTDQEKLASAEGMTPQGLYRLWRTHHPVDQTPAPVIVTASGGGITSALWTAEVLSELQSETPAFGDALLAVSSVSGGGVGAMYFLDGYAGGEPPSGDSLAEIRRRAGTSSLLATTWGFAYRDIWWSLPIFNRAIDRGYALETSWRRRLHSGDLTLRQWQRKAARSWRPPQIFNATSVETGERFLLMPLRLGPKARVSRTLAKRADPDLAEGTKAWDVRNFLDLYGNADLEIVTAARLSATFPFVSPIARPIRCSVPTGDAFHLADGGYFDNHGVATAIDLLRDVLPLVRAEHASVSTMGTSTETEGDDAGPVPRVILVQIRVGGEPRPKAQDSSGYLYATIGPVTALNKVRTASQVGRNAVEIDLLRQAWAGRVALEPFVFELRDEDAPLSWHLTESDKLRIRDGWNERHRRRARRLARLLSPTPG